MNNNLYPIVEIVRLEESFEFGTFGIIKIQKEVFCVTLEPPDIENAKNISSIPAQQYMCWKVNHPKYGETFEVKDVPDRSGILFHKGNTKGDTRGCIILAEHFGKIRLATQMRAVKNSGVTFKNFRNMMFNYSAFHLTIKEVY